MSIYDTEIDLRPYISAIRRRWWLIAIATIVTSAGALGFSLLQEKKYEAVATILLTRSRASLNLANQFPTITEPVDSRSRMEAMISIAGSEWLAEQTIEEIQQALPTNGISLGELKKSVVINSSGDTIQISAKMSDPESAAFIANSWAQNAVKAINYAYTEEQLPTEIRASLEPVRVEYEHSQENLEAFLRENQIAVLQKQIDETSALLDELVKDRTWKIEYNVRRKQKMEQVINQAEILSELLQSRSLTKAAEVADALAVMRLRANAFGEIQMDGSAVTRERTDQISSVPIQGTSVRPVSQSDLLFNVQITELTDNFQTQQDYQRDLAGIIERAQKEKVRAESELLALAQQSLDEQQDELFTATSTRLRNLQSELEKESAKINELTSLRDLSLEVYQALIRKEAEVTNNLQTSSTVNLASPAVPPLEPSSRGTLRNTLIGGAVGFLIGTIWVLGTVWIKNLGETDLDSQETR